jgi:deazaflavin-dependent oxidoreductase (nitroreductase family)
MARSDRIRPPSWFKLMNKVIIRLLRLGPIFGKQSPVVLTVPGRKSSRPRSTLVTPMLEDGKKYVVSGFPGADWVENVRAAGEVTITRGRMFQRVRMVEISPDEACPVLRAFPAQVPIGVGFMKRFGLVKAGTPDEFEALADRCVVFRLDPA